MPTTPGIGLPSDVTVDEDSNDNLIGGLMVTDPDGNGLTVTIRADGLLSLGQVTGLVFSAGDGTDDSLMQFSGSAADINAALATLTFDPVSDEDVGDLINFTVAPGTGNFASVFDLSALLSANGGDGSLGFTIPGLATGDQSGRAVSSAGDLNGDGIADVLISARYSDPNGVSNAGEAYVVFGSAAGFSASFDLSTLNGVNGFRINGIDPSDVLGDFVASVGDVNGDGIDDIAISAINADPGGNSAAGETYIVFGSSSGFSASFDLSSLNGSNGFILNGIDASDLSGVSVSAAGDVNGDGVNDIIIGAYGADPNGASNSGETYIVFGSSSGFSASFDLSSLNGANGFVLNGINAYDVSGWSVSSAGDINGDGVDDLLVGAYAADPNGPSSGQSYVVFGTSSGFSASFDLSTLNGTNGFVINGIDASDQSGFAVSDAGDINGDGVDDIIIGANYGNSGAGESYVVFGSAGGFGATLELSALNGANGFVINGETAGDQAGYSVSSAGDINGDGLDDLIIGALYADPHGVVNAGEAYVVFGKSTGFSSSLDLANLSGADGFIINGLGSGYLTGRSVSGAGDVNGDGIDDLIIGADGGDPGGVNNAGETYIIYGREDFTATTASGAITVNINAINDAPVGNGDIFGAEDLDVIATNYYNTGPGALRLDFNNGDGTFAPWVLINPQAQQTSSVQSINLIDWEGDGDLDALIHGVGGNNNSVLYLNDGSSNFTPANTPVDIMGLSVVGDFDGDGDDDIFSTNLIDTGVGVYGVRRNDGNGVFVNQGNIGIGSNISRLQGAEAIDLDSDGDLDIFLYGIGGRHILTNDGSGNFTSQPLGGTSFGIGDFGDLDGDGDIDMITTNSVFGNANVVGVWLNDGTGNFAATPTIYGGSPTINNHQGIQLLDYDTDGDLDAMIFGGSGFRIVYLNDGNGAFSYAGDIIYDGVNSPAALGAAVFFDIDGDTPVFLTSQAHTLDVLANDTDVDTGDTLIITEIEGQAITDGGAAITLSSGATVALVSGELVYEGATAFAALGGGETAVDIFSYTVSDSAGATDTAEVRIRLTGVNDAPVVAPASPIDIDEDQTITITQAMLLATASDAEGDALTAVNLLASSGTLTDNMDGTWSFTPAADDDTSVTFTYDVTDGESTVSTSLTIDLTPVNDAPTLTAPASITVDEDSTANPIAGFSVADVDGDTLTVSLDAEGALTLGQTTGLTFTTGDGLADMSMVFSGAAAAINAALAGLTYDPASNDDNGDNITISVQDGSLVQSPGTFAATFELSSLLAANGGDGSLGFVINGINLGDISGFSVSSAGDINGDGIDDLVIGGQSASVIGESYIVFGTDQGFAASIDLSSLNGSNGFTINGASGAARSGYSVSSAGDINGDGIDDFVIGAPNNDGESYVVFGSTQGFAASLDLSSLNGANGFTIEGIDNGDESGSSVSSAGDVNGDGIDDLIIGAFQADPDNESAAGESYVVFGSDQGFSASLDLGSLNGTNGFVLNGIDTGDYSGHSVAAVGDINGDGIDDVVIGAYGSGPGGDALAGETYVVFGSDQGFSASVELSGLDGSNGFTILGIDPSDYSGISVDSAGDFNGDGFDDLIIGASLGDPGGNSGAGESYIVFGSDQGFGATLDLSSLDGTNGFVLNGVNANDQSGRSVASAGDINGDGFDDIIIGAYLSDPDGKADAGESYIVFGSDQGFSASFDLSSLNGANGFAIRGIDSGDLSGYSVSSAGDVNGDGIADLVIGAYAADPSALSAGETYIVFGRVDFQSLVVNGAITVNINPVNDAPTGTGLPADIAFTEDTAGNVDLSGLTLADVEGDALTLTLTASASTFAPPADGSGVGAGVTAILVSASVITLAGSAADISTYLDTLSNISYTPASDAAGNDVATISVTANDGQGSGDAALGSVNIDVTAVNDAPTIFGDQAISVNEGGSVVLLQTDFSGADVDDALADLTYTISSLVNGTVQVGGVDVTSFTHTQLSAGAVSFVHDGSETTTGGFDVSVSDDDAAASGSLSITATVTPQNDAPTISGDQAIAVSEGASVVLTTADFVGADVDDATGDLTYSVSNFSNGTVQVGGADVTSFTHAQLTSGAVSFLHDGSETTSGGFDVVAVDDSDASSGALSISATVTAVNDAPTLSGDQAIAVNEGGAVVLAATDFVGADADDAVGDLTYTVSNLVNGSVQIGGIDVSSFTHAQLTSGVVSFVHDGSETTTGGFEVVVADDDAVASGSLSITATVTPQNDAPTISGDQAIAVSEGASVVLTIADVVGADVDDATGDLIYSVSNLSNGTIQVGGVDVTSFTHAQLTSGAVSFLHDGSETTSGGFDVAVADDDTAQSSTLSITAAVTPVNDAPTLSGDQAIAVNEGEAVVLTSVDVLGADADDADTALTYTVSNVVNGAVQVGGVAVTSFTHAQLTSGAVSYVHDGSETTNGGFDLVVADDDGAQSSTLSIAATVTANNDAPTISGTGSFAMDEGAVRVLSITDFVGADVDDAQGDLSYTVSNLISGAVEVGGVVVTSFTHAQLAAGEVSFAHDGSETTAAGFDVSAVDDDTAQSVALNFAITIGPVNDAPTISGDQAIAVDEGGTIVLTSADVLGADVDDALTDLTYEVTNLVNGAVQVGGADVTSFTHAQLTSGAVSFVHDGSETTAGGFDVHVTDDDSAQSDALSIAASITPVNDAPTIDGDQTIEVSEGEAVVLAVSDFAGSDVDDASGDLTYSVSNLSNGSVQIGGVDVTSFTHAQLAAGEVSFLHDGSETTSGGFDVAVADDEGELSSALSISASVTPVNDAPVISGDLSIELGGETSFVLTTADLSGADADDAAAGLTFAIFDLVNGSVQVGGVAVTSFTQLQLEAGDVSFVHDGSKTTTGSFTVILTDDGGTSAAASATVSATINAQNEAPTLSGDQAVDVDEGGSVVLTTDDFIGADVDDATSALTYSVSDLANGAVQVAGLDVTSFTHAQLVAGDVSFVHDGTFKPVAGFSVVVSDAENASSAPLQIEVAVELAGTVPTTEGNDDISSGDTDDNISGEEGDDVIDAGAGADIVLGGDGDDTLLGGENLELTEIEARIYRIYQATLDRIPDVEGLTNWKDALESGAQTLLEIIEGFVGSPEFQTVYGALSDAEFVELLYNNVLGRSSDPAGLQSWLDALADGASRAEIVLGFSESPEFIAATDIATRVWATFNEYGDLEAQVYRLYRATLGREPDAEGFRGWMSSLEEGTTYLDVVPGFVNSPEFQAVYGALDDEAFIELLYNNVLGRASDAEGLQGWLDAIANGASRADVVRGFAESGEFGSATLGTLIDFMRNVNTHWNDVLVGGPDDDILFGGRGADRFVFDAADAGSDTVLGLEPWDIIEMTGFGYTSEADFAAHLTQQDSDVVFSDQGVTITFTNTDVDTVAGLIDLGASASPAFQKSGDATELQNTNIMDGIDLLDGTSDFADLIFAGTVVHDSPGYDYLPQRAMLLQDDDYLEVF